MATCRVVISEALRSIKAVSPGESPGVDELTLGLEALQALTLEIHEARGPLLDVDVTADYLASENQRVRIQAGSSSCVTLPNSIPLFNQPDPYDYGFSAPAVQPPMGSTGEADGQSYRQPRDGARIEVVGTTNGLWFYRADINQWVAAYGLTLDAETPFNSRLSYHLAALTAERAAEQYPAFEQAPPGLAKRAARAREALMLRLGTGRDPVTAVYY